MITKTKTELEDEYDELDYIFKNNLYALHFLKGHGVGIVKEQPSFTCYEYTILRKLGITPIVMKFTDFGNYWVFCDQQNIDFVLGLDSVISSENGYKDIVKINDYYIPADILFNVISNIPVDYDDFVWQVDQTLERYYARTILKNGLERQCDFDIFEKSLQKIL